uniref:Uncharacterized protein n=1 Tax=Rhizophora mucronata TaxID=61149 RepID=A0A2P2NFU2_RHIMU
MHSKLLHHPLRIIEAGELVCFLIL